MNDPRDLAEDSELGASVQSYMAGKKNHSGWNTTDRGGNSSFYLDILKDRPQALSVAIPARGQDLDET